MDLKKRKRNTKVFDMAYLGVSESDIVLRQKVVRNRTVGSFQHLFFGIFIVDPG